MKTVILMTLFFGLQSYAVSFAEQAKKICETEVMYMANPPKLDDCVKNKMKNPDYKSVLTDETFSDIKN